MNYFVKTLPHVFFNNYPLYNGPPWISRTYMLYLIRHEKFAKGGSFETDFCHKEVTDV